MGLRWFSHKSPLNDSLQRCPLKVHAPNDSAPQIRRDGIYRILVCRPNHRLGNAILLTPLIAELERLYQGAEIDLVVEGHASTGIFSTFFSVNRIYCLPKRGFKHPLAFLAMLLDIRKTAYDLIVDPCVGSGFSRALTRILRGHRKVGFSDKPTNSGLTHRVPLSAAPRHMAKRAISLLRWVTPLDARDSTEFPSLDIRLTDMERAHGKSVIGSLLASSQQTHANAVIGIFANATGAKCYPKAWWTELIAALKALDPRCSIIEIIPMHGRSMLDSQWPGYYSTSIRRMGAVMSAVDLMISADCGVMHLAVASKVSTVGMFCVTDEAVYGPYGSGSSPLLTQGQSASETARSIVDNFHELLGSQAGLFQLTTQDATTWKTPDKAAGSALGAQSN
jgi:heptosyltransferase III